MNEHAHRITNSLDPSTRYSLVVQRTGSSEPIIQDAGTHPADAYSFAQHALAALEARQFVIARLWDTTTWVAFHPVARMEIRIDLKAEIMRIDN